MLTEMHADLTHAKWELPVQNCVKTRGQSIVGKVKELWSHRDREHSIRCRLPSAFPEIVFSKSQPGEENLSTSKAYYSEKAETRVCASTQ